MRVIEIAGRSIGRDCPPYVIAELSANHNGSLERAIQTIDMAKAMGADAVKIQTYTADTMTIDSDAEDFMVHGGLWDGFNLYRLYEWAQTPLEWHRPIFEHAKKIGLTIFSTPFDESAVDLLESLNTPAYKIASFEMIDIPLIKYVAKTGRPMIISTGMATLVEIEEAVDAARESGCENIALLHCISSYPAPIAQSNLRTISDLESRFDVVAGLSDHTMGTTVSIASVATGACIIEKHVTLSREEKGPDSEFSLEPYELERLCVETTNAWLALGEAGYERKPAEMDNLQFRRSIYVVKDIKEGDVFTEENIRRIRPGYGVAPKYFDKVLGSKSTCHLERGMALKWEYIEGHK
jgi:pseudaminic acid synthase